MKRSQAPITTFFQRKQVRRISIDSINSDSETSNVVTLVSTSSIHPLNDVEQSIEQADQSMIQSRRRDAMTRRETREDLTGILQRRELVGCVLKHQLDRRGQYVQRRRKQQLVRWVLTHFQRLPLELQLSPHWEQHAGDMNVEAFYASFLEFDAQGVLLAAGASNGIIALYDFDEVCHRSLNLGQQLAINMKSIQANEEKTMKDIILHPVHTIFTSFEVKCIRWNPLNEDEIACSFTNRNEIYVFNLREFPSKPRKVLKSSNQPSSGYNDLLYLVATALPLSRTRLPNTMLTANMVSIVAGDSDGAIRMWDLRFPLRPVWSFLAGSLPINALLLSSNKQFLICGNGSGMLMTYDIQCKVVPAFGSKPVPQRKASFNIKDMIKPYLSPALLESVLSSSRYGPVGIMSMRLVPQTETQVLCQLRNDWMIVIDYLRGSIVKLHTYIRGLAPSVLSTAWTSAYHRDYLPRSVRNSWLSCHRCTGTLLFNSTILCTGVHDSTSLNMIDLHQLRHVKHCTRTTKAKNADEVNPGKFELQAVERLDRIRIPTNSIITAVAAHPNQHAVICGGENMKLQIIGAWGSAKN